MKLFGDHQPEKEIKTGMSSWEKDEVYREGVSNGDVGGKQRNRGRKQGEERPSCMTGIPGKFL